MKRCPKCLKILELDDKFCPECGSKTNIDAKEIKNIAKEINEDIQEALNEPKNESSDMLINYKQYLDKEPKYKKVLRIIVNIFFILCALGALVEAYDYFVYYDLPITAMVNVVTAIVLALFVVFNHKKHKLRWVFLVIAFGLLAILGSVEDSELIKEIDWSTIKMNDVVPNLHINEGEIYTNSNEYLSIGNICDVDEDSYNEYVKECKDAGFIIDMFEDDYSFEAYNVDGYRLQLYFYDDTLDLYCNAPINMNDIYWPNSYVAELLPEPDNLYGKIDYDSIDSFSVYLGDMSYEDFITYTDECIDGYFGDNYYRYEYHFSGTYENYHLNVTYEGFNIVHISIYNTEN